MAGQRHDQADKGASTQCADKITGQRRRRGDDSKKRSTKANSHSLSEMSGRDNSKGKGLFLL